ncbi:MAG TPA: methyltransferase domain-containing protein [Ktedonobacteraceae bacterium]|nr:methyltransferase domain-containing protein [Ktedonobacteraceae bacterium]
MGITLWKRRKREAPARKWVRTSPLTPAEQSIKERRFLENSYYLLPKDVQEINRLDFQHFLLRRLLGSNYATPLPSSTRSILDVGCGTGLWVREMAQQFPRAQVVGLDLELSNVANNHPANCWFVAGNILQGLSFSSERFDFVHQRLLVAALPAQAWPVVVKELVRVTSSSGWVEMLEIGQSMTNPGPATSRYLEWWMELSKRTDFDTTVVEYLGDMLQGAGLKQVHQQKIKAPAGQWGGHAGTLLATDMIEVLRAMKQRYCTILQLAPTLFDATLEALPAEWEEYHTAFHFYLAYGQK